MTNEKTIEDLMCEAAYELHPNDSGAISWRNAASVAREYAERITRERDLWVQVFERAVASTDHQETLDKLRAIHAHIASDPTLAEQAQARAQVAAERDVARAEAFNAQQAATAARLSADDYRGTAAGLRLDRDFERRERDEATARAVKAEKERDEWRDQVIAKHDAMECWKSSAEGAEAELAEWRDEVRTAMAERCGDEVHCTCVPALRTRVTAAEARAEALAALLREAETLECVEGCIEGAAKLHAWLARIDAALAPAQETPST